MSSVDDTRAKPAKSHQHRSEVRDGMRIDWDVPITMDDGLVLRADVFRPGQGRPLSGDPDLRPLCQGARLPGRLSERVAAHGREASGRHRRLEQPLPELGGGRSGEMGAARLCLRARRFPRRRLLAGLHRSFLAARDQGLLRLHRMGRRAAVVERQGRAQRHLLLRHQPVARGVAAAAAPRRHVHLGRRRRLVPRHDAPWRHPLHVLGKLVRHAGQDRAVRRGRARQALAGARRTGVRAGDPVGGRAGEEPQRRSATTSAPIRSTTTTTRRARRSGRRSRCRCSPPPTGAASRCIRAAISRASCAPPPRTNGSKCTASSTGRTSTPTTAASCSCKFFDYFLHGKKNGWDKQPRVLLQVRHPGDKFVERAESRMAAQAHQVDQALSRSGERRAEREKARRARRR